jgi:hypothetical protein
LVSPKDFREAAIPLLGQGRIKELAYTGARRVQVADVAASTTASIQTNDETTEHESQQTAAPGEEAVADLETGDIEMTTNPTDDATTEPDLEVCDCDDAVHDSKSAATAG